MKRKQSDVMHVVNDACMIMQSTFKGQKSLILTYTGGHVPALALNQLKYEHTFCSVDNVMIHFTVKVINVWTYIYYK